MFGFEKKAKWLPLSLILWYQVFKGLSVLGKKKKKVLKQLSALTSVWRKRWHLFPPEDTQKLYPTRIPYEESSIFSQVDVLQPDLSRFPAFRGARPHVVTLQPGQVRIPDENLPGYLWILSFIDSLERKQPLAHPWESSSLVCLGLSLLLQKRILMQQKSTTVCDTEAITIKRLSTKEVPFGAVMFAFIPLKPLTME